MERNEAVAIIASLISSGLTYQAIADALGVSARSVYRWARGQTAPLPVHHRELSRLSRRSRRS